MPSLGKRDLIQKFPFHLFNLAKPEDLLLEVKDGKLYITNTGVPHNLPNARVQKPKGSDPQEALS